MDKVQKSFLLKAGIVVCIIVYIIFAVPVVKCI